MPFSIRDYTNKMREVDPYKCWPFPVGNLTGDQIRSMLPPLTVPERSKGVEVSQQEKLLRNRARRKRNLNQIFNLKSHVDPPPPPKKQTNENKFRLLEKQLDDLRSDAESRNNNDGGNSSSAEDKNFKFETFCSICNSSVHAKKVWEMDSHVDRCLRRLRREEEREMKEREVQRRRPKSPTFEIVLKIDPADSKLLKGKKERKLRRNKTLKVSPKKKMMIQKQMRKSLLTNKVLTNEVLVTAMLDDDCKPKVQKEDQVQNRNSVEKQQAKSPIQDDISKGCDVQDVSLQRDQDVQEPTSGIAGTANLAANRIDDNLAINIHKENEDDACKVKVQTPANSSNELKDATVNKTVKLADIYTLFWRKKLGVTISSEEEKMNQAKHTVKLDDIYAAFWKKKLGLPISSEENNQETNNVSEGNQQVTQLGKLVVRSSADNYGGFNSSSMLASSIVMEPSSRERPAYLGANRNVDDLAINKHKGKEVCAVVEVPKPVSAWKTSAMPTKVSQLESLITPAQMLSTQPTFQLSTVNSNANTRTHYPARFGMTDNEKINLSSSEKDRMTRPTVRQRPPYPARFGITDDESDLIKNPFIELSKLENVQQNHHKGCGLIPSKENSDLILPSLSKPTMSLMSNSKNHHLYQYETLGSSNLHQAIIPAPSYPFQGVTPNHNNPLSNIGKVNESPISQQMSWKEKYAALPEYESPGESLHPHYPKAIVCPTVPALRSVVPQPSHALVTSSLITTIPPSNNKRHAVADLVNHKSSKMPMVQIQQQNSSANSQGFANAQWRYYHNQALNLYPRDHQDNYPRPIHSSNPVAATTTHTHVGNPKHQEKHGTTKIKEEEY